ncbi:roadblock/LC7 domain-containing protein [Streptomyces sp. PR69]|uniref:roadblock/LC7 domain-containing protein n=1 Tax=Streptomyces sp. PR69 TaxID=2984950 RepID=UPI00226479A9|nr:roadblock/LC7 domain-containing protein [Streptomyces sp. PR69]
MTAEAEVRGELRRLRARLPQVTGALAASADGLVLASETEAAGEAEHVAALTAAALGVALRLTEATEQGSFRELLIRGDSGYVATYAAGPAAVLTLLAGPRTNVGRLHLEARRSGARIGELIKGALERPAPAPMTAPAPVPRKPDRPPSLAGPATGGPADPAAGEPD